MSITKLARPFFLHRLKAIARYATDAEEIQRKVLARLLREAAQTAYGRDHGFGEIRSYEEFSRTVPVNTYEEL